MSAAQGGESYIAVPRWMGLGIIALMVVVALIAVVGLVSLGGRVGAVEGRAASTARSIGDLKEDLSARIDGLADSRPTPETATQEKCKQGETKPRDPASGRMIR